MPPFCNPLLLLHVENSALASLTPARLRTDVQHLLVKMEHSGAHTLPYQNRSLTRTEAASALDLLDNPVQVELFHALCTESDMQGFLHGRWDVAFGTITNSRLWKHSILCEPLKAYMQPALAASLVSALQLRQKKRIIEIVTLVENTPALNASICFEQAYNWIGEQIARLDGLVLDAGAPDYPQRSRAIRKDLLDGKAYEARMLNCLPADLFRSRLAEFGLTLTHLARRAFAGERDFAIKVFSTARLLKVDSATQNQIMGIYTHTVGKWEPVQEEDDLDPPLPKPRPKPKPQPPPRAQTRPTPPPPPPPPKPKPKPPRPTVHYSTNTPPKRDDWEQFGSCSAFFFYSLAIAALILLLFIISN